MYWAASIASMELTGNPVQARMAGADLRGEVGVASQGLVGLPRQGAAAGCFVALGTSGWPWIDIRHRQGCLVS